MHAFNAVNEMLHKYRDILTFFNLTQTNNSGIPDQNMGDRQALIVLATFNMLTTLITWQLWYLFIVVVTRFFK